MSTVFSSVAIGVPTFNRRHFVEANARSLRLAASPPGVDVKILVVDDASADYDAEFLRAIYPQGAQVVRRETNSGGADRAIGDLFQRCLALDADAILLLDSDLIVDPNFLARGLALLAESDGLASLFNTPNHVGLETVGELVRKRSIGSAGALWTRACAAEVGVAVPPSEKWDWRFCDYMERSGRRVFCARDSLVQHIGFFEGENSTLDDGDYGVGFALGNFDNVGMTLEALVRAQIMLARQLPRHGGRERFDRAFAALDEVASGLERLRAEQAALELRLARLERYSFRSQLNRWVRQWRQNFGKILQGGHA